MRDVGARDERLGDLATSSNSKARRSWSVHKRLPTGAHTHTHTAADDDVNAAAVAARARALAPTRPHSRTPAAVPRVQ